MMFARCCLSQRLLSVSHGTDNRTQATKLGTSDGQIDYRTYKDGFLLTAENSFCGNKKCTQECNIVYYVFPLILGVCLRDIACLF